MDSILGVLVGIGLSAACGFRVFVPLLGANLAALAGHLQLAGGFEWLGSPFVTAALAVATLLEIGAYYIPWLDNALDTIASPAAVIAGTITTASLAGDASPFMQWALGLIAGGGTAGLVQSGTVLLRGASTGTTAGLANPILSTGELAGSLVTTILALTVPFLAILAIIGFGVFVIRRRRKRRKRSSLRY